ncbi:MAG: peptidylprolyl isomerase, partial [Thermoguttaceae bacterium]
MLESRWVLSPTLITPPNQVVSPGSPYLIALEATDPTEPNETITYSNPTSDNPGITVALTPDTGQTDNSLSISVSHASSGAGDPAFSGTMTFQMLGGAGEAPHTVARIAGLVEDGSYMAGSPSPRFYQIVNNSATNTYYIQGGTQSTVREPAEIGSMEFTTPGILAIANRGGTATDSNDFFITTKPSPLLDNTDTIFGVQTGGELVRQEIASVATSGSGYTPASAVTITSMSVSTDSLDGVLLLKVSSSATGSATIQVTATDSQGNQTIESFVVTSGQPILTTIPDITMPANTGSAGYKGYTFNASATIKSGDYVTYSAVLDPLGTQDVSVTSTSAGAVTVMPNPGVVGVAVMDVTVTDTTNGTADTQQVPVLIDPLAPTGVTFTAPAGQLNGYTNLDNSSLDQALTFHVTGVLSGAEVSILANGAVIGTGTGQSDGTADVTTDGTTALAEQTYTITAEQTLTGQAVPVEGHSDVDLAGPASSASTQITVDTTPPTVSGVSSPEAAGSAHTTGAIIPITVNFSEPVYVNTVSGTPQLDLNASFSAVATYASGTGTSTLTFDYRVADGDNAAPLDYLLTTALDLNGGSIQDAASNAADPTLPDIGTDGLAARNVVIDTTAPTVLDVSSSATADSAYKAGAVIPITITFSEPVNASTVSGTPRLTLNARSTAVASYAGGTGTATLTFDYTVGAGDNASPLDYTSTADLVLNGGSIQDPAGNATDPTLPDPGTDGLAGQNLVVDTTAPTVLDVYSSATYGSSYKIGDAITITIAFSEPVNVSTVSGTPQLTLNAGTTAAPAVAVYTEGSGTDTLTFTYTVAAGQSAAVLDYASPTALGLNGGSIQDSAGNPAVRTLPAIGTDDLAAQAIVVDGITPTVTAVTASAVPNSAFVAGDSIPISITFSEPVTLTGTGTPQLTLNASSTAVADYTGGSGTDTLTFNYTVAPGDNASPLNYFSTTALSLNGDSLQNAVGNPATLTLPATGTDGLAAQKLVVDTIPPTVTAVTTNLATVSAANVGSDKFTVTVALSEPMQSSSVPTITFTPDLTGTLTLDTGSWTDSTHSHYTADYNVANAGVSPESVGIGVTGAKDAAGNTLTPYTGTNNFTVDTLDPAVMSVTPNLTTLTTANAGAEAFTLTVVYSEAMSATPSPTISFPISGKDPTTGGTLTLNSGNWTNSTTYVATYDVANKGLTMSGIGVEVSGAMDSTSTHTQIVSSTSTVFSIDMPATSKLSGYVYLGSGPWTASSMGISGVTVRLLMENSQGTFSGVAGTSPVQTDASGWYTFKALAAGTYRIQVTPSPDYRDGVAAAGSLGGTVSTDQIQVQVGSGANGTGYNFSAAGIQPSTISGWLWFASAP